MASEVEETLRRIASHRGVEGVIICNRDGVVLRSTLAPAAAAQYGGLLLRLVSVARNLVRATEASGGGAPPDDLAFLRLRTLSRELMVVPGDDFILVAIQAVDEPAA